MGFAVTDSEPISPNAPAFDAGRGRFRDPVCLGVDLDFDPPVPHYLCAEARYRVRYYRKLHGLPPLPPPVTKVETFKIHGMAVSVVADGTTKDSKVKGLTTATFSTANIPGADTFGPSPDDDHQIVTKIKGPNPSFTVTIQTIYGPTVDARATSGYGRGTTDDDDAAGQTTLGFHESCHREDYLAFLRLHPFPAFGGKVGQTLTRYKREMAAYAAALRDYQKALTKDSETRTDEVGDPTKSQYDARAGKP